MKGGLELPLPNVAKAKNDETFRKYLSLCTLVVQNSALVLLLRYSRIVQQPGQPLYIASTVVFFAEIMKFLVCLYFLYKESGKWSIFVSTVNEELIENFSDINKMVIPSGLYAIQNNLLFVALSNLEAATFQITYQMKILSTALFSVILLGKRLSRNKWVSLVLLMVGVILVQLPASKGVTSTTDEETSLVNGQNPFIGLIAVIAACLSSGFAGCYFEKMLKRNSTSMWVRNIQLGIPGTLFSLIAMMFNDGQAIASQGFFQGYDLLTWVVVVNQALGGLLVAVVVKYADNILKGFATSLSIIISSVISFYLFNFHPSPQFALGALIVITSTFMYGRPERTPPTSPTL
ncbi:nucleotide-sugar transporter [Basidiobolus meristosporus CBS 931.73]|uniref:Nucleotide-sugar transporter n=1 Tax=Basidiobolus meristosporus CBS 931.73 TaxID=1314790 RepID=A0A1Y1Z5H1_9FUNG|nr:nucleotide-sugar transporter [Basidiobolus meristosporus CBS 931.73]|eukprot:ORY05521.1 nucleotide-sugar transporter [Basidiobolus meristosporus CBS 931.73]